MKYGSVCSGIEAASAAWHGLGWQPAFFSEIEPFPRAVLAHHYPTVPLHGDFTTIGADDYGAIDLLVGGTPCQSFSVAGLRGGLDDDRGNLALEFLRLADRKRPRWVVWENVPGVLSSDGGRDFGSILGGLGELGYGWAYRVLDAQYFGVAQRRRRVFVVGYLGDWRPAAAVLFERHSLSGHPAPSREARKDAARATASGAEERGGCGGDGSSVDTFECGGIGSYSASDNSSPLLRTGADLGPGCEALIASTRPDTVGTLRTRRPGEGGVQGDFDHIVPVVSPALNTQSGSHHAPDTKAYVAYAIMPMNSGKDYKARETEVAQPIMAAGPVGGNQGGDFIVTPFDTTQISSPHNYSNPQAGDPCHPLAAGAHAPAIAFAQNTRDEVRLIGGDGEIAGALAAQPGMKQTTYIAFSKGDSGNDAGVNICPTIRKGGDGGGNMPAVAYAIQAGALRTNPASGPDGVGVQADRAYTLEARSEVQAVAFGIDDVAHCLRSGASKADKPDSTTYVAQPVAFAIQDVRGVDKAQNGKGWSDEGASYTVDTHATQGVAVAFEANMSLQTPSTNGVNPTLTRRTHASVAIQSAVRRLTPVECERLQGFPDNFTAIPWRKKGAEDCPDGPRYKALGNSMAVPVMRWIGERIAAVEAFNAP